MISTAEIRATLADMVPGDMRMFTAPNGSPFAQKLASRIQGVAWYTLGTGKYWMAVSGRSVAIMLGPRPAAWPKGVIPSEAEVRQMAQRD